MSLLRLVWFASLTAALNDYVHHVDVAIIGAGLSGLSAAKDIAKAGKSFAILEARDRVGGRVLNAHVLDGVQEVGAQWVGPTQDRVHALIKELDLTTYKTYSTGNSTLYRNKTVVQFASDRDLAGLPPVRPEALIELQAFITLVNSMARKIDVQAPWKHSNASEWDSMTLESFVKSQISYSDGLFLLQNTVKAMLGTEMREPSLLYFLAYIAAARGNDTTPGTLQRLFGVQDSAQDSRVNGGTQLLALRLAKKLGSGNIHLSSPVRKISRNDGRYIVLSDKQNVSAEHVIIAMSPPMAARILYNPPLPAGRDQLTKGMPMGSIGKAIAIYPRPWWRDAGLNAQVFSDSGVVRTTYDNSPANASFGAILGFVAADEMRKLDKLTESEAKQRIIEDLVKYFGPMARNATGFLLQRWDQEEFSRGGPVAYAPPGVLSGYGSHLRGSVDNIHFAGTETSPYWTGYMDGAIRSGERAAREVLSGAQAPHEEEDEDEEDQDEEDQDEEDEDVDD